ncbi:hypothetical protein PAHAL_8G071400 [Panicum hallii]|jgi:hypothetical protein|uniref:DUF538 domain-containing protein n=1 Tax=Panicum hallii TaxID=206008 RepID=A0A2S3IDA6_9POAL|nr:uncharacterized protein LOC112903489 [Panicum hallii]PAN41814.1 hypothetical protein PAHAL_8G071400 [Panicum hallii]
MAPSRHHLPLLGVTIALCLATLTVAASPDDTTTLAPSPEPEPPQPTAYEMLERYNFTEGILPEGVTGYVLRPDDSFEVYLPGDCSFRAGSMHIRYSSRVAGSIQPMSITGVEGVKVKVLLAWVGVTEVDRDGDQLRFSAGPVSKSFPVDTFAHSPQCS